MKLSELILDFFFFFGRISRRNFDNLIVLVVWQSMLKMLKNIMCHFLHLERTICDFLH